MELLEHGLVPVLLLILYALVDKVIAPLVKRNAPNGREKKPATEDIPVKTYQLDTVSRRVDRLESDVHEIRTAASEVREKVGIVSALLERVEGSLEQ